MINLTVPSRKNFSEQELSIERGLTVFVGGNGSGKSSLLESVFEKIDADINNFNVVAFTSGPNENFSYVFSKISKKVRLDINLLRELSVNKYFFNTTWAPFLITLAAFVKTDESNSYVFKFLKERNYVLSDIASRIRVPKGLLNIVESSSDENSIVTTSFIEVIEKITGLEMSSLKKPTHRNFMLSQIVEKRIQSPNVVLSDELYSSLLELTEIISARNIGKTRLDNIRKLISVLAIGNVNEAIFSLADSELFVNKSNSKFSNREFSDGEYQLLMTLSLLDLFDSEKTIFLLDEMDSHVHQKMIPFLWESFEKVKGAVLTTTHNPTSLKYCETTRIKALKNGKILKERDQLEELSNIFDNTETTSRVLAVGFRNVQNVILIDDYKDWAIFTLLAKKKLVEQYDNRLDDAVFVHKVTSSNIGQVDSQNPKYKFLAKVMEYFKAELRVDDLRRKKIKNAVAIFDRDTRDLSSVYKQNDNWRVICEDPLNVEQGLHTFKTHGISWNRRDIENYLLTKSVVTDIAPEEVVATIGTSGTHASKGMILTAINSNDEEFIATVDCKDFITKRISNIDGFEEGLGFKLEKLKTLVDSIPANEISPYIELVHSKLVQILFT